MKKNILLGSIVAVAIIVLSSYSSVVAKDNTKNRNDGEILYVGGTGEGNYTKIQDAIDNSSDGFTIFVFNDSSPYVENIIINVSIKLVGENKQTTIIDGNNKGDVIKLKKNGINVSGFTVQNCGNNTYHGIGDAGIEINADQCVIYNNIIKSNQYTGIIINESNENIIEKNTLVNNTHTGILVFLRSNYNNVTGNSILESHSGIYLSSSSSNNSIFKNYVNLCFFTSLNCYGNCNNNSISGNEFLNTRGRLYQIIEYTTIWMYNCHNNSINNNSIKNKGIFRANIRLKECSDNDIKNNNFLSWTPRPYFYITSNNEWDGNYWFRPRYLPKCIIGKKGYDNLSPILINVDWNPAQEPYDI